MKGLEWYVARRYLASRRKARRLLSLSTFIAIGGVAVGVMALLIVIAVMTGLQRDLQEKILAGTPHIFVYEAGTGLRLGNWQEMMARLEERPEVVSAGPLLTPAVMVARTFDYVQPGVLVGIQPGLGAQPLSEVERGILSGEYSLGPEPGPGVVPGILVGSQLAGRLAVLPGDTLIVGTIENPQFTTGGVMPPLQQFVVTGTVRTGMYEYDNVNLYTHLAAVQDMLDLPPDSIGMLAVNVTDPWRADRVAAALNNELDYPYRVESWMAMHGALFSALRLEKLAMAIILSLIIIVASFNIVSMLTMVVTDKTREIGILKSMGMTDGGVLRIFMLQGMIIGAVGTVIGGLLGGGIIWVIDRYELIRLPGEVYFIDTLPFALDPFDVVLIVLVSMLIAFGATIYPARQASRLQPVDAIRHD
ncbi:MAG TPA: ABC transporter permease [Longimicrobiales bacterium]|nr:ABC transporter permease [Longimicrobiales bacterium]